MYVGEGHPEDVTTGWPLSCTQAIRSSSPAPHPWEYIFRLRRFPQPEPFSQMPPWESHRKLRLSRLNVGLNPVQASVDTFQILASRCGHLLISWLPKTSLVSKFPCLWWWPPTSLGWLALYSGSPCSPGQEPVSISLQGTPKVANQQVWECWILDFIQLEKSGYYHT